MQIHLTDKTAIVSGHGRHRLCDRSGPRKPGVAIVLNGPTPPLVDEALERVRAALPHAIVRGLVPISAQPTTASFA